MIKKKSLLFLIVFIVLVSIASASYIPHKQNTDFEFSMISDFASVCILTTINAPYGVVDIMEMYPEEGYGGDITFIFNVSGENYYQLGTYCHNIICTDGENSTIEEVCREVTTTGKTLTTDKSLIYTLILIFSILIFLGLLWFGFSIPSKNKSDEMTGYILYVSNLKYLKYVLLGFSYITLIWISYFTWMLVYAYLDFEFLSNIFRFMFILLVICSLPLFILYVYINIANLIRDSKINDMLSRGLRTK